MVDYDIVVRVAGMLAGEEGGLRTLFSHSLVVAGYAAIVARGEGLDPEALWLAGLLHDLGKLSARRLGLPEDEVGVRLVELVLRELGVGGDVAGIVLRALRDPSSSEAAVVHDADVLSKLGLVGVYTFASKWSVRGADIIGALVEGLPRELAIAYNVERVMRTGTGRRLARVLARRVVEAYRVLVEELAGIGVPVRIEEEAYEGARIAWVVLERCPRCGGAVERRKSGHRGRYCRGVELVQECRRCGYRVRSKNCLQWITG